jgi:hypothetical protein
MEIKEMEIGGSSRSPADGDIRFEKLRGIFKLAYYEGLQSAWPYQPVAALQKKYPLL